MRTIGGLLVSLLVGCAPSTPAAGSERGPCYGNGTCDAALSCLSGLCVSLETDGGPDARPDAPAPIDAGAPERRTYVVSELPVPANGTEAGVSALDLDGDAIPDNALGEILIALAAAGVDYTGVSARSVAEASVITLLDVRAASFDRGSATGYVLQGADPMPDPCPRYPSCGGHLRGTGHFTVARIVPDLLDGTITSASLRLARSSGKVPLPFTTPPVWMPVVALEVRADVSATGLSDGIIAGAMRDADVQSVLLPALIATFADVLARDCPTTCASGTEGAQLTSLFDANHNGAITVDEFRTNGLVASLFADDLDLFDAAGNPGHDGTPDTLSLGFGFTAVAATFDSP